MRGIEQTLRHLFSAISLCLEREYYVPTLQLLYSGIDSLGWLCAANDHASTRERFVAFVERFLLPGAGLKCSALDLYAARCAVLHTMTADSDLSLGGKARAIYYVFGEENQARLQALLDKQTEGAVAIHLSALAGTLTEAGKRLFEEADRDCHLSARMEQRSSRFLVGMKSNPT